jgi:hypothetical protein
MVMDFFSTFGWAKEYLTIKSASQRWGNAGLDGFRAHQKISNNLNAGNITQTKLPSYRILYNRHTVTYKCVLIAILG